MTARQVAAALGLNERTVRRAIKDGRLPAPKIGGEFEIDLEVARRALGRSGNTYAQALADALYLLRSFGHEADAQEVESRHGIVYIEPRPVVQLAPKDHAEPSPLSLAGPL